jgi:hypothetical protein
MIAADALEVKQKDPEAKTNPTNHGVHRVHGVTKHFGVNTNSLYSAGV